VYLSGPMTRTCDFRFQGAPRSTPDTATIDECAKQNAKPGFRKDQRRSLRFLAWQVRADLFSAVGMRQVFIEVRLMASARQLHPRPARPYTPRFLALQRGRGDQRTMFERFTEKARRAIFFARYEASQYGSPYIETEHLLLGLLREDRTLLLRFALPESSIDDIRAQIEKHVSAREYISTRVEIPLTSDSRKPSPPQWMSRENSNTGMSEPSTCCLGSR
jgi:hypothetical protein